MREMTKDSLKGALAGESQAHIKYLNFAEQAEKDGKANVARLFRAASFAEQVHASAHLRVLKGINSTLENLQAAAGGENFEVEEMYPAYMAIADEQGEKAAKVSFNNAYVAEQVHFGLYQRSLQAVEAGNDAALAAIHVCPRCGFTAEGAAPDRCPLCGTVGGSFVQF